MNTSEQQAEELSALIDDELSREEAERAIDALLSDHRLKQQWHAGQIVRDVLQGRDVLATTDLAARVRQALDDSTNVVAIAQTQDLPPAIATKTSYWPRIALAASVALAAVLTVIAVRELAPSASAPQIAQAPVVTNNTDRIVVAGQSTQASDPGARTRLTWNDPRPDVAARLNGYLLNHSQYQSTGVQGMLPYARVVGYEPYD